MAKAKDSPKTGGRQKGTPNKLTADVKAYALDYSIEAIKGLVAIGRDETAPAAARVSAWSNVLDRAVGKPPVAIIGGGEDAAPVVFTFNLDKANALTARHLDG